MKSLFILLFLASLYGVSHTAKASAVERVHLDGYDVPLGLPGGQITDACSIELRKSGEISRMAFVGTCEEVLPRLRESMTQDGTTVLVTLSINGHNINLM
ncbi:hypothetical protein ABEQ23_12230 [Cutibacterium acnes]